MPDASQGYVAEMIFRLVAPTQNDDLRAADATR